MRVRTVDIGEDVADVLRGATWQGDVLILPPGQLERKLYQSVDKVLTALGGKWNRGKGGHLFAASAHEELAAALNAGGVVDRKRTLELFETPLVIAERMALIARRHFADRGFPDRRPLRLLEPSAGRGNIIGEAARWLNCEHWQAVEIDPANCDEIRLQAIATEIRCGDFLSLASPVDPADVILMNPPFGNRADIAHVSRAYHAWLAPGGVLVAIMSAHFTFGESAAAKQFRDLVGRAGEYESLPAGTFRQEGTDVNSVLVTLRASAETEALAA